MKTLFVLLIMVMAMTINAQEPRKAFGPINFGMTKEEVRKAVKATDGMKMLTGQLHTFILGDKYWGYPEYDANGFVAIMLNHYTGNMCSLARNFTKYQASDFETDINSLIKLFNDQYGESYYFRGYVNPGFLEMGKKILIGGWKDDVKVVQIWEEYVSAVAYPVIIICSKEKAELNGRILNTVKQIDEVKTKELF